MPQKVFWPNIGVGRKYQILEIPRVFLRFDIHSHLDLDPKSVSEITSRFLDLVLQTGCAINSLF